MYSIKDEEDETLFDLLIKLDEMGYESFWIVAQEKDELVVVGHDPVDLFTILSDAIVAAKASEGSGN
tara:strand:+ start:303 stop:503 length:201 start_codon:yes stop_codon:yes gene_type:complete